MTALALSGFTDEGLRLVGAACPRLWLLQAKLQLLDPAPCAVKHKGNTPSFPFVGTGQFLETDQ